MPFKPAISAEQCCDCTKVTLKDISDYTTEAKNTFTSRSVQLLTGYNQYYIPQGYNSAVINWPLNADTIDIPIDQDYAMSVEYTIVSTNPQSGSQYQRTFYLALSCNLRKADDNLIKMREIDQDNLNLDSYRDVIQDVQLEYLCAMRRVKSGDIVGGQKALDRGNGIYNDYIQNSGV